MSKPKSISRRKLLGMATVFTGASVVNNPFSFLFESVVNGFVNRALAQEAGYDPRRYIYIQQPGAPARWSWDLFLTPYSAAGFVANPMIGTKYSASGGRYTGLSYATIAAKGINVPHMWQFSVPKAGGGMRPMTDLLDNLLSIQGISTENAGHPGSQLLHFKPSGAIRSLPALTGDFAPTPIAAVNLRSGNYSYNSLAGKTPVQVGGGGNMLQTLLNPFISTASTNFLNNLDQVNDAVEDAITSLDDLAKERHPAAEILSSDRAGVERLLKQGFPDLANQWNSLKNKYSDLISRAIDPTQSLAGLTDKPIGLTSGRGAEYALNVAANEVSTADLRTLIKDTSTIGSMAEHFAVAEYVILNDLSRSVSLQLGTLNGLSTSGNDQANFRFDEHNTGGMVSLYLNSMYYRALASCLLELIDQLKSAGLYEETVLDVGGEFNRSPRRNAGGSDHGWQGASVCLYSGAINGPLVIGNLKANGPSAGYPGTWGYGAEIPELGGKQIGLAQVGATIATLLRAPSPVTSTGPLVAVQNGQIVPIIGKTKIIS